MNSNLIFEIQILVQIQTLFFKAAVSQIFTELWLKKNPPKVLMPLKVANQS